MGEACRWRRKLLDRQSSRKGGGQSWNEGCVTGTDKEDGAEIKRWRDRHCLERAGVELRGGVFASHFRHPA